MRVLLLIIYGTDFSKIRFRGHISDVTGKSNVPHIRLAASFRDPGIMGRKIPCIRFHLDSLYITACQIDISGIHIRLESLYLAACQFKIPCVQINGKTVYFTVRHIQIPRIQIEAVFSPAFCGSVMLT